MSKFLTGFLPPTVIGVVLAILGGYNTIVFCNTLTPVPPNSGDFCMQGAWLPFWDGLLLVPVGIGIGIWLALRSSHKHMLKMQESLKLVKTRRSEL